jgi:hypothetical protein
MDKGNIRVIVAIDDGRWRAIIPMADGFIEAPRRLVHRRVTPPEPLNVPELRIYRSLEDVRGFAPE